MGVGDGGGHVPGDEFAETAVFGIENAGWAQTRDHEPRRPRQAGSGLLTPKLTDDGTIVAGRSRRRTAADTIIPCRSFILYL
jgi:hypothetical protein